MKGSGFWLGLLIGALVSGAAAVAVTDWVTLTVVQEVIPDGLCPREDTYGL